MATWSSDPVPPSFGLYVHVPFCTTKCPYCDFSTAPYVGSRVPRYVEALTREAGLYGDAAEAPMTSVFIGGGTPSLLTSAELSQLMSGLRRSFTILEDAETTLEASPEGVNPAKLEGYRHAGVDRLSLGVQSFDDGVLAALGREHGASDAAAAVRLAREAGFANVSVDLMFGAPNERLEQWRKTLSRAISLDVEHVSVYGMTLEPKTVFGRLNRREPLPLPDDDAQAEMYEHAVEALSEAGYRQYETSNYARPGYECRHNLTYWRNEPYIGLGASAWGYLGGERYGNVPGAQSYVQRVESGRSPVIEHERLSGRAARGESVTLALRMTDGLDVAAYTRRFGAGPERDFGKEIQVLVEWGLLERHDDDAGSVRLRLT